jgi:preprotein translocase subunit YajC
MTTDILLITFIFAVILIVMVILDRRDSQSTKDMIRSFAIKCGDRWILPTGTRTDWIDVTDIVNAITKTSGKDNKVHINIQNGRKCYNKASEIKGRTWGKQPVNTKPRANTRAKPTHEHWYNRLVSKLFRFH